MGDLGGFFENLVLTRRACMDLDFVQHIKVSEMLIRSGSNIKS